MSTPTVFIAGSRQISRLPADAKSRLDTTIEKGFQILVGDANGVDKAVQQYFSENLNRSRAYAACLRHSDRLLAERHVQISQR